jgi:hypothetical protein
MWRVFVVLILSCALGLTACSGGGDDDDNEPSSTAAATSAITRIATPPPAATPSVDIREVDVAALPEVAEVLTDTGGTLKPEDITFADVTNDGFDEAIAPVASGGTLGYLGFFILTPEGDSARVILQEFPADSAGLAVAVVGEKIEFRQPVPGPDDPECCPSFFRRTIFAWNGTALAVESVTTEINPDFAPQPDSSQ